MLGFVPVFILLGAAIVIFVLQFVPRSTGIAWFASVIFAIAAWVMVIILHTRLPFSFTGKYWIPLGVGNLLPALQIDIITWPFVLSICSLVLGILLVSSAQIGLDSTPREWAAILIYGALGYVGVSSANILTVMLVLGCLDLLEVVIFLINSNSDENSQSAMKAILWRFSGLVLFLSAYGWQISKFGMSDEWRTLQSGPVLLMLAAIAVRLRLVPFLSTKPASQTSHNGLTVMRSLTSSLVVFSIVIQLPFFHIGTAWNDVILIYLFTTALVALPGLIKTKNLDSKILIWQVSTACIIFAAYLLGFPAAGIAFSISSILLGAILLLDYPINPLSKILGILAVVTVSGLPFTPNVSGISAFGLTPGFPAVVFILPVAYWLYFSLRLLLEKTFVANPQAERWTGFLAPVGFVFMIASSWVTFFMGMQGLNSLVISIPGFLTAFICIALLINFRFHVINFRAGGEKLAKFMPTGNVADKLSNYLRYIPSTNLFEIPVRYIGNLFEGEGGVLWSVLSLVLIITVIRTLGIAP